MNHLRYSIPADKRKCDETIDFYKKHFGFISASDSESTLISPLYKNVEINIYPSKVSKQKETSYLSFYTEKDFSEFRKIINDLGIKVDIKPDSSMHGVRYIATLNDPSGNLVKIYCKALEDDNNKTSGNI